MLAILGVVFLLASSCYSSTDSSADIDFNFDFDSDINFNELIDKTSTYDGSFESLIDPSIAEDANLNVVSKFFFIHLFWFKFAIFFLNFRIEIAATNSKI